MCYEQVKRNYERGLWSVQMVQMAVRKGIITEDECDEILGEGDSPSDE